MLQEGPERSEEKICALDLLQRDIITKLNTAITKALNTPATRDHLFKAGIEAQPGTPESFQRYVRAEIQKMSKIIKASGAKPEV